MKCTLLEAYVVTKLDSCGKMIVINTASDSRRRSLSRLTSHAYESREQLDDVDMPIA